MGGVTWRSLLSGAWRSLPTTNYKAWASPYSLCLRSSEFSPRPHSIDRCGVRGDKPRVNKSAFGRIGIAALIGGVVFLIAAALLIYSLKGTSLRYTIDGLVVDSPKRELRAAVASGDSGNILRAFGKATYRPVWSMGDAIPTMQAYLSNSNPLVRLYAAKALYMFGDRSGYTTLVDLVSAPGAPVYFEKDQRVTAAELLAQYRQTASVQVICALYPRLDNPQLKGEILEALETLSPDTVKTLLHLNKYYADPLAIRDYALENYQPFLPQITSSFQLSDKPKVRAAAAWALATMTKDTSAIDYLAQTAQAMLDEKHSPFGMRDLVKYLGAIQDPRMKPLLEQALDSDDPTIVQCAIVNLLYNQGGSEKAKGVLAEALNLKRMNLQWDFVLQVSAQFKDDPKIKEAGERFTQTDVTKSWQLWTGDRLNWPIYNWINDYVIKLNEKK